ncbi:MAG: VanW family protein [Anaerolineae bacterium]|nr:MAG: VanW family protein [Anaerolineae bacterium]
MRTLSLLKSILPSLPIALLSMLLAAGAGLVIFILGTRVAYSGRALPGVSAAGISVGGLSEPEIELALGEILSYPRTGRVLMTDGTRYWVATPGELGVALDIPRMADQALTVGREGGALLQLTDFFSAWSSGVDVPTTVLFDQRAGAAYMNALAAQIDRPQLEAKIGVDGIQVAIRPGQIGRQLEIERSLEQLAPVFASLHDAEVPLAVKETPPMVLDATEQGKIASEMLKAPLTLTTEDAGPWTIDPQSLAEMLRFNLNQERGQYEVGIDRLALSAYLEPLAPELLREPENARFVFNDDTRELDLLAEAVIGRTLDIPASIEAINQGLLNGEHEMALVFELEQPAVGSDATAAELGITEEVSVVSSYFAGSSPARIHNITTSAAPFHGLLIAPGETLSMAEVLGDISLDTGYAEALIIYGNRTIKGVGGGVCQVSTTLFRAAFFGGFGIVERNPHAYRVGYYEQGPGSPGPGFDATVYVPLVDFKFTNDTDNWLLSETYIYGTRLLWKFYSTGDGRQVQISGPQISNKVDAPKPLYKVNPDLEEGKIKQVDFEADGMDVLVTRTVTRGDDVLHRDTIKTHYLPWRAIYEYGPGTELPDNAITDED